MSPLELSIREHAWSYVHGEISRDQFMDWLAPLLMDGTVDSDPLARDLAGEIFHFDAEFTSGAGTEQTLREAVRWRLQFYRGTVPGEQLGTPTIATGSDNLSTPDALLSIGAAR